MTIIYSTLFSRCSTLLPMSKRLYCTLSLCLAAVNECGLAFSLYWLCAVQPVPVEYWGIWNKCTANVKKATTEVTAKRAQLLCHSAEFSDGQVTRDRFTPLCTAKKIKGKRTKNCTIEEKKASLKNPVSCCPAINSRHTTIQWAGMNSGWEVLGTLHWSLPRSIGH